MLLLRANHTIRTVFLKMIKTMGDDISWTETFMIINNDIVLTGKEKSLFFNVDNRSSYSNYIDIPLEEGRMDPIVKGALLENTLNMILYAFGKWGGIKDLKVEMNYEQLNGLLNKVLSEIDIEANLTPDYFRFYKKGITLTYEDVIQVILDQSKEEPEQEEVQENENPGEKTEEKKHFMGLWHKIQWESGHFSFVKKELTQEDKIKHRLGRNFYRVGYLCPSCNEILHMVVYPEGREYKIETDEEPVYLARAYTCEQCNRFYTAKPQKLIIEGEAYHLDFEDDRVAYLDYLELIGESGERTSNINFNEYESVYLRKGEKEEDRSENLSYSETLEELMSHIHTKTDEETFALKEKMDEGFYPENQVKKNDKEIKKEIRRRKRLSEKKQGQGIKLDRPNNEVIPENRQKPSERRERFGRNKQINPTSVTKIKKEEATRTGIDSKKMRVDAITTNPKSNVEHEPLNTIQTMEDMKDKSYIEISRMIDKMKLQKTNTSETRVLLDDLQTLLQKKGEVELKRILLTIPNTVTAQHYKTMKEKIEQYKVIDISSYISVLNQKRDDSEKQEISEFIKTRKPSSRRTYYDTYQKLKEQGFNERNVQPYLDKLYGNIEGYDRREIKRICPEPADVTVEEGRKAYDEISKGDFLPEVKANTLALLEKRLSKLKMDECELLVRKLQKNMGWSPEEYSRIYLYNLRKMTRPESQDRDVIVVLNALNIYALARGKYEYPIMICDDSRKGSGKTGFVLTPDNIYYNSFTSSGFMKVEYIEEFTRGKGLFKNGIYVNHKKAGKVRIASNLKIKDMKRWLDTMNEYIVYLQEKPESRDISYLAKEKHEVVICYRCGYSYGEGEFCPRCGSKN